MPLAITELGLPGVLQIDIKAFPDNRGFFAESYNERAFAEAGITTKFVQDNFSYSRKGVIRGLHLQRKPHGQVKLVRAAWGEIFDVVADCDPVSPTFGKHVGILLSNNPLRLVYVPEQYAHGVCVTSEEAILEYRVSDFHAPDCAAGFRFDDPLLAIDWPIQDLIVSAQDQAWPLLSRNVAE